jgi:hypothetical protein
LPGILGKLARSPLKQTRRNTSGGRVGDAIASGFAGAAWVAMAFQVGLTAVNYACRLSDRHSFSDLQP